MNPPETWKSESLDKAQNEILAQSTANLRKCEKTIRWIALSGLHACTNLAKDTQMS